MIKYSEFVRFGTPSIEQIDKLVHGFVIPLNNVRAEIGMPMFIRSGFRDMQHEIAQGRTATSEHTFKGKGACDVALTANSSKRADNDDLFKLASLLVRAGFTRIAYYPKEQFFHIDYKADKLELYISDSNSKWARVTPDEFYKKVLE